MDSPSCLFSRSVCPPAARAGGASLGSTGLLELGTPGEGQEGSLHPHVPGHLAHSPGGQQSARHGSNLGLV